jgi:hypothetical protein
MTAPMTLREELAEFLAEQNRYHSNNSFAASDPIMKKHIANLVKWENMVRALPEVAQSTWQCKANPRSVVPEDCNWPYCGCDPQAGRVMQGLIECGWEPPINPAKETSLRSKLVEIHDITQDTTLGVECWQKLQNIAATAASALSSTLCGEK